MIRRPHLAVGLIALAFGATTASASAPELPVPLGQDLPVEIVMNQQELEVDVSQTAAAVGVQFGLLGALVGSAIQNEQQKAGEQRVVPLRDMLIHYSFNDRLEQALRAKLPSDGISANPHFIVMKTAWDAVDAQNSKNVPLHAMVITPRYSVDSDLGRLNVQLTVAIVDREIRDDGKVKSRYQFSRLYGMHFPLVKEKSVENLARWQAMGAGRLQAMLDEGIAQVADVLVHDMSADGRKEWAMDGDAEDVAVKGETLHGHVIRQTTDLAWVRSGWRRAQTVQGIEPVSELDATMGATTGAATANTATGMAAPTAAPIAQPAAQAVPATNSTTPNSTTTAAPAAGVAPAAVVVAASSIKPLPAAATPAAGTDAPAVPQPATMNATPATAPGGNASPAAEDPHAH
ncbi:MAG TPA: hypothetical protein VGH80_02410 [Xanthomonadaceae bacterium]